MRRATFPALAALVTLAAAPPRAADPLPSWNDTAPRKAIVAFVERVSTPGSPDFVPAPERIVVFDNDGTLWSEQPMYFQALFVLDRIKALAPRHPEWKEQEPFASVLRGDVKAALERGEHALAELAMATHAASLPNGRNPGVAPDGSPSRRASRRRRRYGP